MRFRIRPTLSQCRWCLDLAVSLNGDPQCHNCNTTEYEMIKMEKNYVYYIDKNELKRVHMNYVVVLD